MFVVLLVVKQIRVSFPDNLPWTLEYLGVRKDVAILPICKNVTVHDGNKKPPFRAHLPMISCSGPAGQTQNETSIS